VILSVVRIQDIKAFVVPCEARKGLMAHFHRPKPAEGIFFRIPRK
jgi:hypothetical protein